MQGGLAVQRREACLRVSSWARRLWNGLRAPLSLPRLLGGTVVTDFPGLLKRLSELLQIKPQGAVSVLGISSVVSIGVVSIQII